MSAPQSPRAPRTAGSGDPQVSSSRSQPCSRCASAAKTGPDDRAGSPRCDPNVRGVNSRAAQASNRQVRQAEAEQDRALIEKARGGDERAFHQLVVRHQRRAFAIALGLVRDENDAREVVQEAFLRVYRSLAGFYGGSSFFTWLYRIVTNLSIDLMRKPSRREAEWDDSRRIPDESHIPMLSRIDGADPAESVRNSEIQARVEAALAQLPPYHRGVILMREVEGMSYEEMAQAMRVSKGTIMSRLFHARQKLQRALAECYEEQVGPVPAARRSSR
jgi:RNA polymerase sigma-70 factor (ECF subfamily)